MLSIEKKVVARAVAAHEGTESAPFSHWHAEEELGLCTECDAAGAMAMVKLAEENDD